MPAYTILFMRKDVTDRRPLTITISTGLFWTLICSAIGLPILGFLLSYGIMAPAWLKLDVKSMEKNVEKAQVVQQQNTSLQEDMKRLQAALQEERQKHSEVDAKLTMAETARQEASERLGKQEGELLALKKSVATYERMLKPKLQRELLQCVDIDATMEGNQVNYAASLTKMSASTKVPDGLSVRVRVLKGDNALTLAGSESSNTPQQTQKLDITKQNRIKGSIAVPPATADGNRLLDIKVFDSAGQPIAYCWKSL